MGNYYTGKYVVVNQEKYAGPSQPTFRSGWEKYFMEFCDSNPNIISWASEPVSVSYTNPVTGKASTYVPDFIIVYMDRNKKKHAELIEIKPSSQSDVKNAKTRGQVAQSIVNAAKWEAATKWAAKRGMTFRVLNEQQIYMNSKPQKKK